MLGDGLLWNVWVEFASDESLFTMLVYYKVTQSKPVDFLDQDLYTSVDGPIL